MIKVQLWPNGMSQAQTDANVACADKRGKYLTISAQIQATLCLGTGRKQKHKESCSMRGGKRRERTDREEEVAQCGRKPTQLRTAGQRGNQPGSLRAWQHPRASHGDKPPPPGEATLGRLPTTCSPVHSQLPQWRTLHEGTTGQPYLPSSTLSYFPNTIAIMRKFPFKKKSCSQS